MESGFVRFYLFVEDHSLLVGDALFCMLCALAPTDCGDIVFSEGIDKAAAISSYHPHVCQFVSPLVGPAFLVKPALIFV